jgi:hypothetical protein
MSEMNNVQFDFLKQELADIKENGKQVHNAIYGNGKIGLVTDLAVAKTEIAHLKETVGEAKVERKGVVSFIRDNMAILLIGCIWVGVDLLLHFT